MGIVKSGPKVTTDTKTKLNVAQAAARLGVALRDAMLEDRPLTMSELVHIVADKTPGEFKQLHKAQRAYYTRRTRSLIDSISLVGGLPIAEEKNGDGRILFFLLEC